MHTILPALTTWWPDVFPVGPQSWLWGSRILWTEQIESCPSRFLAVDPGSFQLYATQSTDFVQAVRIAGWQINGWQIGGSRTKAENLILEEKTLVTDFSARSSFHCTLIDSAHYLLPADDMYLIRFKLVQPFPHVSNVNAPRNGFILIVNHSAAEQINFQV